MAIGSTTGSRTLRLALFALLALVAPALGACNTLELLDPTERVDGSGTVIEEERDVDAFTRLDVGGAVTADVTVGPARSVTIRSDDNIVALYETVVEGGTLHIRPARGSYNIDPTDGIHVTIAVPELEGVDASGAASVAIDQVAADGFDVDASGAATVTVDKSTAKNLSLNASGAAEIAVAGGSASTLVADLSGAASLDTVDLKVDRVTLEFSGAAHGQVNAIDDLQASLSGGSSLCYAGEPGHIGSEVTGGASLDPCP